MLADALGDGFDGVLVSDVYAAYSNYKGRHQYCWAHLLREADDLAEWHWAEAGVAGWTDALPALYGRARAVSDPAPVARRHAQRGFETAARALVAPWAGNPTTTQKGCASESRGT
jgi:transposase